MATLKPLGVYKVDYDYDFRQEFKATHLIKRTQCPVVIIGNDNGLLVVMTKDEVDCWVEANELQEVA